MLHFHFGIEPLFIGQIYSMLIISLAAADSSIGLAILVIYHRIRGGISIDLINLLKG